MSTIFRDISSIDAMPSHVETSGRVFGLGVGKTTFRSGLFSQDNSRLNMQFGNNSNNVDDVPDQRERISNIRTTNFGMRSFGLQSRNLTAHSSVLQERSMRVNQDYKINNTSVISKPFWPAVRNTTLTTGLQMQDSVRYNDDIDEGGFRRPPTVSRVIRGRNSTLSSRLFHNRNAERHYKDLSNINGFNVSHISRRDVDTLSESRLALNMRSNWMDNQSMSGSVLSVVSMKAQFMNVLENLHHSILSIGPHVTAEAVRMEFDKAKQGLENISEMSYAPSVKPPSVISQSSKYICPPVGESAATTTTTTQIIDGGSFNLKSSKDLLKTLISSKDNYKNKFNLTTHTEEEGRNDIISSSRCLESDNEENSSFIFKKPKPYSKKLKNSRSIKIKAPQVAKNLGTKGVNKVINLQQWFPIAVGSDLAFCGVDENGSTIKTEPVKKRLNNRKVELITGFDCNLIGSPSPMVSVLPQKIATLLKNGLTERWRVLQKELLNCQTAEGETKKRKSKSPKSKTPPGKKAKKSTEEKTKNRKSKSPKVISTPKKKEKVSEMHTRSGRTIKPPAMFWLATGSNEVTSSLDQQEIETTITEVKSKRKWRSSSEGNISPKTKVTKAKSPKSKKAKEKSPSGKASASPRKTKEKSPIGKASASPRKAKEKSPSGKASASPRKAKEKSPSGKASASPRKTKKPTEENSFIKVKGKSSKAKSPKQSKKKATKEEVEVHSSTENTKRQNKNQQTRKGKRKREVTADADSVQSKKSKLDKKTEVEVESTVISTEVKNSKKTKNEVTPLKPKASTQRKRKTVKKETVKNISELERDVSEFGEFEKNFELKLDDIEIPEIANISGNPQLSRSQLRLVSMETPPLKYFSSNLKLLRNATPVQSPDWYISQRTESEVKQFQRRREEAFKKRIKMNVQKTVTTEKSVQNRDVKRVMEWVAEKTVKSPQWNSKVLQYVIPSRKRLEEEANDDEDFDTEFL